jgi:molecular chaperone DnaK
MMRDAEQHAEEDKARREEAEVRNNAEALVYQTEKFLADNADKVPAEAKSNVEEPLAELKKAIEENDAAGMRNATDKVAAASQALGAAMYSQAEQDGTAGSADAAGEAADMSEEDVVDAEIVDEDESK